MTTSPTNSTNSSTTWVRICPLDKLPTNKAIGFTINGQRMIVARCDETKAQVMQGYCTHMGVPLANAKIDNCAVTCWLHHSTFSIQDGSVLAWSTFPPVIGPALAAIRQQNALRTYETRVENGEVLLSWPAQTGEQVNVTIQI